MRRYKPKYVHSVPLVRRRRQAVFTFLFALLLLVVLAVTLARALLPDTPEPNTEKHDPADAVHIFTMEPRETPEAAVRETWTRYPVPLEDDLQRWIEKTCDGTDISPAMALAIIATETRGTWDRNAVGDNGKSLGLMQINTDYHTDRCIRLNVFNLYDPYQNVAVGVDILKELYTEYEPDATWCIMAYNGGPGYAYDKTEKGETSVYARQVLLLWSLYVEEAVTVEVPV